MFMRHKKLKLVLVILIILFSLMVFNVIHKVVQFKGHTEYLKNDISKKPIQKWMSFRFVEDNYRIKVSPFVGENLSFSQENKPISNYCEEKKINCTKLIEKLEKGRIDKNKNGN